VGNSRKRCALGVKVGSRMPPLRTRICIRETSKRCFESLSDKQSAWFVD
jgi:hypothetical protein